jgi:DNA polymerase I-like protein with 3'-5' exonuclease and polymerase domains
LSNTKKIYAIDIETEALPEFEHIEEAALIPHLSRITVIGISDGAGDERVFRGPDMFQNLTNWIGQYGAGQLTFCGHNLKFDLKHLNFHDPLHNYTALWEDDTQLMAHVLTEKVPETYLAAYEEARLVANEKVANGASHRKAGGLSLKVLAPYFLGVDPFWETPDNHNNDEYVLKDARYTARLRNVLEERLKAERHYEFYKEKQLPWTKTLLQAELHGIRLDTAALASRKQASLENVTRLEAKLREQWGQHLRNYDGYQRLDLKEQYEQMFNVAAGKLKEKSSDRLLKLRDRYSELCKKAESTIEPFNFDSPKQLTWLLKEALGYNLTGWDGEEATDKEVLQRLAMEGKEDVKTLLEYRKERKLATTYYPTYEELVTDSGRIHSSFNATGARTGRTSSQLPNMQQVPPSCRDLFVADQGCVLVTRDVSALEPVLIAYYSGDTELTRIIRNGESFHSVNAKEIFNLDCSVDEVKNLFPKHRDAAKEFGLSVLYGAGANRVKQSLDKRGFSFSLAECKTFVQRLRDKYKGVWNFKQALDSELEAGTTIYNYMGRPIRFTDPEEVYMKGFNKLIQGSGSDIMQAAIAKIAQNPDCKVLLFVHDEVVVQVPEERAKGLEAFVEDCMTDFNLGDVRLSVEGKTSTFWSK